MFGNPRAPVTVVVFADFECPHCKAEAPIIREVIKANQPKVKMVYKHFPLSGHPRAVPAAIAAEAGLEQGKFWEMHDLIFANQTKLTDQDLEKYAQQAGLDIAKYRAFVAKANASETVDKDRADGEKIGIGGTPAVYVNGRFVNHQLFGGKLQGWIDDALRR